MRLQFALCLTLIATLAHAEPPATDWLELLPPEDLAALEAMPEIEHAGAEGDSAFYGDGGLRQRADLPAVMYSTRTVAALDGRQIRLGGYPVPLESTPDGRFRTFFLVPYPGACIHVPPPPPNQIVLVRYPQGVALEDIYAPLWVSGTLRVEQVGNQLAEAAYALDAEGVQTVEEAEL
ncbi:DUF3299 domain-containing protein [Pseudomonas oryzae]|uniref:DUF3299 domain-containing protein n=1 Tax=Pseudomonas oryzae TaxID=1392877 RepID=A0A1H1Y3G9_9PSED|nr:DUF3299 domain-containing protein [Pseudomonas oryzae]SDT16014.1 hypothetical protein SAMN05216221_3647 [Pseudomonas oryzae]